MSAGATSEMAVSLDVSAVPSSPAGAGVYILRLAEALARRSDLSLRLITRKNDAERFRSLAPEAMVRAAAPGARPARLAWEQTRLPRVLRGLDVEVHHSPHYTMPEASHLARVVTVHDLTFFDHPEWHEPTKAVFFRRAIRVAARHADTIVCVSETTAARLRALCPPKGRLEVVRHGVDQTRFRPTEEEGGADRRALAEIGVEPPYVAFVGTIEPRKDLPTLIRAFDRMCGAHPSLRLVVAGGRGWGLRPVDQALERARFRDRIVQTGYLDEERKPALLRQAAAVAYPSLEEGFGMPVLEALACGSPLVTTTGSAMEELAEGAAVLVAPGDVDGLAGALDMVVRADAGLPARRVRGLAVAARHTWAEAATAYAEVYRQAREAATSQVA
ncbi:MAG: glycosyltransferase family 4 protein [Acidimicrobiales bacterium]|nr:glycosyltransferase family 4 protein [Acidimicrobiales bacterium]MBO0886361.1 glycosyltransferase family 4 protein [Acidimicrobiales bacterium]